MNIKRLRKKKAEVSQCLEVDSSVAAELLSSGIFNDDDERRVNDKIGFNEKALEAVRILIRKPHINR